MITVRRRLGSIRKLISETNWNTGIFIGNLVRTRHMLGGGPI